MLHEAQSLHLRYGLDIALSTLNSCRYLHEPKTRFPVRRLVPFPGREFHPLEAPGLSWRTETGLDVALQNPLRVGASQCFEALFHRIGAGPLLTEPIRVFISSGFYNGGECEQIQCLLRSILHRGNSEWAHRFAVRLRDVNTS